MELMPIIAVAVMCEGTVIGHARSSQSPVVEAPAVESQRTATLLGLEDLQWVSCSASETSFDTSTVLRYTCQLLFIIRC